ncbi:MAG: DnaB-like helicase C-terminal domain-containing protein [Candidatus Woesearchaeota archaeon]
MVCSDDFNLDDALLEAENQFYTPTAEEIEAANEIPPPQMADWEKKRFEQDYYGMVSLPFMDDSEILDNKLRLNTKDLIIEELEKKLEKAYAQTQKFFQENRDLRKKYTHAKKDVDSLKKELAKKKPELDRDGKTNKGSFDKGYGKKPPQAVDIEEVVLSCYLQQPKHFEESGSAPYLSKQYYKEQHNRIFSAMMFLGRKLTPYTLVEELRQREELEEVGGPQYINSILKKATEHDHNAIGDYKNILYRKFVLREAIRFAEEMQLKAFAEGTTDEYKLIRKGIKRKKSLERVEGEPSDFDETTPIETVIRNWSFDLLKILSYRDQKEYHVKDAAGEVVRQLDYLRERNGRPEISTGYKGLDRITHGVKRGKLALNGARPKTGKTTLLAEVADNVAKSGHPALLFCYESTVHEVTQMLMAKRAKVDLEKFEYYEPEKNDFTDEEYQRVLEAQKEIENLPILLKGGTPDLDEIASTVEMYKAQYPGLAFVGVDGLQAFSYTKPEDQKNKSDWFYHVLHTMKKGVAEEKDVFVWMNAQLKVDVERYRKPWKKPRGIEDFSDCKGIPEVADIAMADYRPEKYYVDDEKEIPAHMYQKMSIIPLDLRKGKTRGKEFNIGCDISTATFYDYVPPEKMVKEKLK